MNSQGQTFAVIEGPVEFSWVRRRRSRTATAIETLHRRRINRRFAIATKEVTVEQYQRFLKRTRRSHLEIDKYSPDPGGPMNGPIMV